MTSKQFRDLYTDLGGARLKFNGKEDGRGKKACSQYVGNFGCSVHLGRPLACRLFPIGRQIQSNEVHYIHQGDKFPCLDGCADVVGLPHLSVGDYLKGQVTSQFEQAQDEYLEVMQNLADIAFELLLDSGLSQSGDTKTLSLWRKMGSERSENLVKRIGEEWMDCLTTPNIINVDKTSFANVHNEQLQLKAQKEFVALQSFREFHEASVLMMAVVIQLARSMGGNPKQLTEYWIDIAKQNGALE